MEEEHFDSCDLLEEVLVTELPESFVDAQFEEIVDSGKQPDHNEEVVACVEEKPCTSRPSVPAQPLPSAPRSSRPAPSMVGRVIRNAQLYREPNCLSKTVTYPVLGTNLLPTSSGASGSSHQMQHTPPPLLHPIGEEEGESAGPSTSNAPDEEERGHGRRKLSRLTLMIGQKCLRFKVIDVPPEAYIQQKEWADRNGRGMERRGGLLPSSSSQSRPQCNECSAFFNTKEELRKHIVMTHNFRHFPCSFCGRTFMSRAEQTKHLHQHIGEPHECHICKKAFTIPSNLVQHLKIHASGKRFFCEYCGKCFRLHNELALHTRRCGGQNMNEYINTNRPLRYSCSFCDKLFHHRRDQVIHERIHTGERPYECGYCGRRFTQSQALTSHIRVHTGERPYACTQCPRFFRDSSALRKHEYAHDIEAASAAMEEEREEEEGEEGEPAKKKPLLVDTLRKLLPATQPSLQHLQDYSNLSLGGEQYVM